jgi:hypothetical protein
MTPDDPIPDNSISGASETANEPAPSLREIAEAAYDEGASEEPSSEGGLSRDERGRFASKAQDAKTGEAERVAPSPEALKPEAPVPPDPAAAARSSQAPDHWSAEDRAVFERLPPDAKQMLQRRYSEMEADYTRKSQANASAVQAVNALAPIFQDPEIVQSLQQANMHPIAAIQDWASMHKRGISPRLEDRAGLMIDLAVRMGFDPAKLFAPQRPESQPNLPPQAANDPAVRYFADQYGKTASEMQALRNEINAIHQAENRQREEESLKVTRWSIDTFADEKGPDGKPLRPDFDEQLPYILELFKANPERDLVEAYDLARRMNPKTWESMVAAQKAQVAAQQSTERARAANRGNIRGLTGPVSKPNGAKTGNGTLRDTLEASAEEVGFR